MNYLEKMYALLCGEGRKIKYGVLTDETDAELITLQVGRSDAVVKQLNDGKEIEYPIVILSVYSAGYMSGFQLLESLKEEIKAAQKTDTKILHLRDNGSEFDKEKQKYLFRAEYRIIK